MEVETILAGCSLWFVAGSPAFANGGISGTSVNVSDTSMGKGCLPLLFASVV